MESVLFWSALPASLVRSLTSLVSMPVVLIGGIYTLVFPSGTPTAYIWGALILVFIRSLPFVKAYGILLAKVLGLLNHHEGSGVPANQIAVGAADTINGAWIGFLYNGYWIQYANSHSATWYIWINWFLTCCSFWAIVNSITLGWYIRFSTTTKH